MDGVRLVLSDEARRDVAAEFVQWRAGVTLPVSYDEARAGMLNLAARLTEWYGPGAVDELRRIAYDMQDAQVASGLDHGGPLRRTGPSRG